MRTHAMGEMTVKEVREYLEHNQTVILPYGVVEQHGYHLPLSTDTHYAEIPSYELAKRLDCIVAPPLNYCFSGGELPGGGADYIIVPKLPAIFGSYRLADVEPVTSFTNRTFHIFRNLNPERISIVKNPDAFFCGEPKRIRFTTDACNASLATLSGISHPEPRFSWTSGKLFSFSMPMDRPYGEIKVDIVVERTFNGRQRFLIRSEEDFVACGVVEKATTLSFRLKPKDLTLGFSIELPDARRVSEVRPDQQDTRVLALGIREIRLAAED